MRSDFRSWRMDLAALARTSAMQYKHSGKRVDEIGRELDVDYILEGSVRRLESRARTRAVVGEDRRVEPSIDGSQAGLHSLYAITGRW
jgi:TolB-like protein